MEGVGVKGRRKRELARRVNILVGKSEDQKPGKVDE